VGAVQGRGGLGQEKKEKDKEKEKEKEKDDIESILSKEINPKEPGKKKIKNKP
jgi:hypothetical protein